VKGPNDIVPCAYITTWTAAQCAELHGVGNCNVVLTGAAKCGAARNAAANASCVLSCTSFEMRISGACGCPEMPWIERKLQTSPERLVCRHEGDADQVERCDTSISAAQSKRVTNSGTSCRIVAVKHCDCDEAQPRERVHAPGTSVLDPARLCESATSWLA
jgi:hypothetical protein